MRHQPGRTSVATAFSSINEFVNIGAPFPKRAAHRRSLKKHRTKTDDVRRTNYWIRGLRATGEEVAQWRWFAASRRDGFTLGILEHTAVTPHACLVAETVAVRAFVMAAGAMALGFEECVDEAGHPNPSAPRFTS